MGYFSEMGIGTRRDPLAANAWYVRAADQGDERAKHRLAAIRSVASGVTEQTQVSPLANGHAKKGDSGKASAPKHSKADGNVEVAATAKETEESREKTKKKWGIF